jgi:hypothetical protein
MRRALSLIAVAALIGGGLARATPSGWHGLRAGVGVVDATWHVGAGAGQYASDQDPTDVGSEWDPNVQHVKQQSSYGVESRLSIRAIVLESPGRPPVALVKDDNYLAQDMLVRRAAQILQSDNSKVTYDNILLSATHDHNSPYYSTPAYGVWLFQDVTDLRMFEYQARAMAKAIEKAERSMRPARVGATTVHFRGFQGNIAGAGVNEDGSPTGYPLQDNDHGLVVMRFDDMTKPNAPKPLATWVNYAEHGESLDGYDLISGDWFAPFERYVDRATGVPVVFSQGSVGSAEGPYEHAYPPGHVPTINDHGDALYAIYGHMGYAQAERGTHLLASKVLAAWQAIGGARNDIRVQAPYESNPVVSMLTHWVPGPVSHPYPSVGNCRTGPTVKGDPGVPAAGLPDCARMGDELGQTLPDTGLYDALKEAGVPIPDNYDVLSHGAVEENLRLKLQTVRIGKILLASCACEPQSDLIKALETRTDTTQGNRWNGFDYAEAADVNEGWPGLTVDPCHAIAGDKYDCPDPRDVLGTRRLQMSTAAFKHMEAEINNPSDGWDDPAYALQANSEPTGITQIKGNFTSKELSPSCGYALPVGLGHTGDYNGYTVSYREYMARDAYRKALTSYGPHTADYMVTRLMAMAANLRCGTPIPAEPLDGLAAVDEARQEAEARALGQISSAYYDLWSAQIPDSAGPAAAETQPKDIERFDAATFTWTGGDNWTDNPNVVVQRLVDGHWKTYARQHGEVQTILKQPPSILDALGDYRSGSQKWTWIASFEAFDAYPRADVPGGQTPAGTYRFAVDGHIHQGGDVKPYHLASGAFSVSPWTGLTASGLRAAPDGTVHFSTPDVMYPRTYKSPIRFVHDDLGGINAGTTDTNPSIICKTCTYRPWATSGEIVSALVTVRDADGHIVRKVAATMDSTQPATGRTYWTAAINLQPGETAEIAAGGLLDGYGETNGTTFGPVD